MRPNLRALCVGVTVAAAFAGACSETVQQQSGSPAPALEDVTDAYLFSQAEVDVQTSEGAFTATTLDPADESGYDPSDEGVVELSGADGKGVIITWQAGTEPDVKNAFVRVDLGPTADMQYPDMLHFQCTVTVPTRTPDGVAGSIDCNDLPNFEDTNKKLASASGTFTARR